MQKTCVLMLTYRCNLNCIYCYQKHKTAKDMTLETAKSIIEAEVQQARTSKNEDGIRFDLFGGEPFLRFGMIKELCNWVWETIQDIKIDLFITTNGTLLDEEKKEWLRQHKEKIHLIMSVDGKDDVQEYNRGCYSSDLPIDFVLETLPDVILSMTVSRQNLSKYANQLIYFHEQGYHIDAKLAQGEDWQKGDGKIYEDELNKIAEYYLEHPKVTPIYIFKEVTYIHLLNNEPKEKYAKVCGAEVEVVAYDVEGKLYPCHHFLPNVNGKDDVLDDLKNINFSDTAKFTDEECMKCDILKLCRTCCARNYNERGDVSRRDRRLCQIMLAEAKVISSYQIKKYMRVKEHLTSKELLILKSAIKCYQLCCDFEQKYYKSDR